MNELVFTLEASVESLETDFRPMDVARDIFKSTPNLNNKECGSPFLERVSGANLTRRHAFYGRTHLSAGNAPYSHIRSTSYTAAVMYRYVLHTENFELNSNKDKCQWMFTL